MIRKSNPRKGGNPSLDITHFFQSIPNKISKTFVPNDVLESIIVLRLPTGVTSVGMGTGSDQTKYL
jgi:hypothetical protein